MSETCTIEVREDVDEDGEPYDPPRLVVGSSVHCRIDDERGIGLASIFVDITPENAEASDWEADLQAACERRGWMLGEIGPEWWPCGDDSVFTTAPVTMTPAGLAGQLHVSTEDVDALLEDNANLLDDEGALTEDGRTVLTCQIVTGEMTVDGWTETVLGEDDEAHEQLVVRDADDCELLRADLVYRPGHRDEAISDALGAIGGWLRDGVRDDGGCEVGIAWLDMCALIPSGRPVQAIELVLGEEAAMAARDAHRRDTTIRGAVNAGLSLRTVAQDAGISHEQVRRIAGR